MELMQIEKMPRAPEPVNEPTTLLEVIANAAANPAIDPEKMMRLLEMRERLELRQAKLAFDEAMSDAQAEMQPVRKDADNPQIKSRYASHAALDIALRPIYTRHGFSMSFDTAPEHAPDYVTLLCDVTHRSGHSHLYRLEMPADGKGAKGGDVMPRTHATGSAVKYGMRYLTAMIFNVAITDRADDDDGNAAGEKNGNCTITAEQTNEIQQLIVETGSNLKIFLNYFRCAAVAELPAKKYQLAIRMLKVKQAKNGGK